jgi:hypothetical protein
MHLFKVSLQRTACGRRFFIGLQDTIFHYPYVHLFRYSLTGKIQ